ncbi:class I SAM-dependent methyltransferase [Primorskyibacter sp. 2E233]|uniref:class I SAM-dependent methyltransferase n=1 Tax=Primorskyibacter sp. 2E233 TaxID=3413431 RepID=UPI003BF2BD71
MITHLSFWDRAAEKYAVRPVGDPDAYDATLERVRHWLRPDMAALELGCGTGSTALRLCDAVREMTATDISEEMIRIAKAKQADGGSVNFVRAEAGQALAPGMDVVLAFNLLHLVGDGPGLLRQVRRALPKGGLFISKTACLAGKPWLRLPIAVMQMLGKAPSPIRYLSVRQLEAEIVAAGFEIVETGDYPKKLPNHFVVARAV